MSEGFSLLDIVIPPQYQLMPLLVVRSRSGQIQAAGLTEGRYNSLCYDFMLLWAYIIFRNIVVMALVNLFIHLFC